jgi:small conductance mechanosensitive channel
MQTILQRLQQIFSADRIANSVAHFAPRLVIALVVFLAFYLLYRVLKLVLARVTRRAGVEPTAATFLLMALKYVVLIAGVVMALQELGLNVTTILEGLGIIGLALGFAAKDTLSNIIAGFFLFWDKPFVIGDLIEVSDEYGEVREITMRTTRIVTVDGKLVSFPNSVIVNSKIRSYTLSPHLRLDIDVTIGVNEKITEAREVILDIVRGDERFLKEPPPEVVVITIGDYFLKIELKVWLRDPRIHIPVREELREAIKNALDKAGITMPYETIELVKHDPGK